MVYEGQGEIEKAKANVDEVLVIDSELGIPDDEDREHRQRLNGSAASVERPLASNLGL